MVPHLITALTGPINELEQRVIDSMPAIERWFRLEWMEHTPPFYSSVDVRNAGFKLAPVDTNLFPDNWNQLTPQMLPLAVQAAMAAIEKICPEARNLLVIPENRTDSPGYLQNVAQLVRIFHLAGLNVRVGSVNPDIKEPTALALPNGDRLTFEPVVRSQHRLGLQHFDPCTILLNTDLSAGAPGILEDLHEQYLLPPLHAGWSVRRKSHHFRSYEEVSKRFGKLLGIDPWLINPMFNTCGEVDLAHGAGIECLTSNVDTLLARIKRKYKEYGINEKAFVVVKSDNGTSGRGVATVRDVKDLDALVRKARAKAPGDAAGTRADMIIQEGVLTNERIGKSVAEPVVYMMDRYVVGGFYRVHGERGVDENLNAPGTRYQPLEFDDSAHLLQPGGKSAADAPNRFYMYGVVGRLAMLAASYEMEATDPYAEVYE
ncbi:glutamate--cysteine ligase [Xylophilus ampelinus]|uniref:Glutamate--cysteine ligase n=1 Tax=Xylophilus ampelinus TaxID=54067 RepID=A0A318SIT1_9BURK|nr:glutamate--cysteine ligase [Xylophilus ampelinus]MCS4511270.1 glutamate--cysteine ligase [Xylophilus ampelinus]PYE74922.1 glutamate--cysteine ligase [Xylophilus ampelinus]